MAGAAGVGRCGGGGRYGDAMVVVGEDAMIEIKWRKRIENAIIDLNK